MTNMQQQIEKLAVAQAVYKVAANAVSTKDPDSLRAQVDEYYRGMYEQTGAKSYDLKIGGEKVGTYSIKTTKEKNEQQLVVNDNDAFARWCAANDCIKVINDFDKACDLFAETGEMPDGCELITKTTPEGLYAGSTLRVDPYKVNKQIGGTLTNAGLLGE